MFCKHSENGKSMWEVKDKTILPSAFQQIAEAKQVLTRSSGNMFITKVILILVCELCGKIDKTIEEN